MRRAVVAALATTLVCGSVAEARADPGTDQKAAAQVLFEQAQALVEQNHFAEACPKFAESQKLDPGLGTMLWLADCYENNGQTASAWATFKEAAATAAEKHDKRERVARERAERLEPKLPRLMILVPAEAASQGLVVERDGIALGAPQWGLPVPVDPGVHAIGAKAPDRKPWTTTVQLPASAETLQVTVPALDPIAAPTPPLVTTPMSTQVTASASSSPETSPASPWGPQRILGVVVAGLGVVGVGVGTYFAFHAESTYDDASSNGQCQGNACDAAGRQERSDAFNQATIATVAMSVGAAAVAGGAILYFLAPRQQSVQVGVAPDARGGAIHVSMKW